MSESCSKIKASIVFTFALIFFMWSGVVYLKKLSFEETKCDIKNVTYTQSMGDIDIIGCGGITCGEDAMEYILCGASAVQIGTQLYQEGIEAFSRIEKEMLVWLAKKNYKSLLDFQGKLKTI